MKKPNRFSVLPLAFTLMLGTVVLNAPRLHAQDTATDQPHTAQLLENSLSSDLGQGLTDPASEAIIMPEPEAVTLVEEPVEKPLSNFVKGIINAPQNLINHIAGDDAASLNDAVDTIPENESQPVIEPLAAEDNVVAQDILDSIYNGEAQNVVVDSAPLAPALAPEEHVAPQAAAPKTVNTEIVETAPKPVPRIAIIIDDMGPDRRRGFGVIKIDAPLTLAFLPYAERLPDMTKIAADRGHELMIHMPMEPENSKLDIGSIGLRDGMSQEQWSQQLDQAFASFKGYAGLNNHMGSLLTQNQEAMDYLMTRLIEQGLYFVDSKTISTSIANDAAKMAGLKSANRDVFLDHENNIEFVRTALKKLEKVAFNKGHAIAIGHPKDVTIQGLNEWIPTLEAKGIELVHASALVKAAPPLKEEKEEALTP